MPKKLVVPSFKDQIYHVPEYAGSLYNPARFKKILSDAVEMLKPHSDKFDSIVLRGASGTLFGGALSVRINKPLFVVRKPNEVTHACESVAGNGKPGRWLFVDDFVCTGTTLRECKKQIGALGYVGRYTYTDRELLWETKKPRKG